MQSSDEPLDTKPAAEDEIATNALVDLNAAPAVVNQTNWLSSTKDAVGIVQNLFAIAAIIAAGIWFFEQDLRKPVIKTTLTTNVP